MSRATDAGQTAFIGIGGNVGDVVSNLRAALTILHTHPSIEIIAVSHLYRTPPWGMTEQDWFINACASLVTSLSPVELLEQCLEAEKKLKRVRSERWGPRTIDIDVLTYAETSVDTDGLQLPHPRMTERAFVLQPLADLAPDVVVNGATVKDWLEKADNRGIERLPDSGDWWPGGKD